MTTAVQVCAKCEDSGWEPTTDAQGRRRVRRCGCWLEQHAKAAPGVPLEFKDAALETFAETQANRHAARFAAKWVAEPQQDIYVWGPVGSGKTRLACSMLNEYFRAARSGLFARVPMLLLRLQPSDVEHDALFWRCCEVPMLVLDDLGAERETATDYTRRTLLMLYEERFDRGLQTIWTSNKSLSEIGDFMQDERLVSRIAGRAAVIELSGTDWRVTRRRREREE